MQQDISKFLFLSRGVTTLGFILIVSLFFFTSPYQTILIEDQPTQLNVLNIVVFYISLFLFFAGVFTTFSFWLKRRILSRKILYVSALSSFRQGILMGILICTLLFLQSQNLLIWWDALLVVLGISLIEMYLAVSNQHED